MLHPPMLASILGSLITTIYMEFSQNVPHVAFDGMQT